jgi:Xaa-Pro aminopeptidase
MIKVKDKINSLRSYMKKEGLHCYIITGSDPHMSEYVAPRWRTRAWFSHFTGSAGTLVITADKAGLWTDFRYWIQAAGELEGSGIDLFKQGLTDTIPFVDWIASELKEGDKAAIEGSTISADLAEKWKERLVKKGIILTDAGEIPHSLWAERPNPPSTPLYTLPIEITGKDRKDKIDQVRDLLLLHDCGGTFISSLDDIAWVLNIRAMDVTMNPVALAYCWIGENRVILFTDVNRFKKGVREELEADNIEISSYEDFSDFLGSLTLPSVYLCKERNSWKITELLPGKCEIINGPELTASLKSQKNMVEIDCFRKAMVEDGAAMVNFIYWLKTTLGRENITEISAAKKLRQFRAAQPGFIEESFTPIPGYAHHGALCHYDADEKSCSTLLEKSLFLLDSGGQYEGATTDITRTFALGEPSSQEKTDYTLVLKGHIALSQAVFPQGTKGYQLDLLARQPLWNHRMNYGHGTGHGVGAFLNVHEGPHSISPRPIDHPLILGSITSNEPGLYREGSHGIRIENLILTISDSETEFGNFYKFETLTLCPYEKELIDIGLLERSEISWINEYHKRVFDLVSPLLSTNEKDWLKNACTPL